MKRAAVIAGVAAAVLLSAALCHGVRAGAGPRPSVAQDSADGAELYAGNCAGCHGAHGEGEPGWQTVGADGRVKAPPHDASGHTWMHGDAELFQIVKWGPGTTAAPGWVSPMPTFAGRLSDREIRAVLAFIKMLWPVGHRAYQMTLNPGFDPADLPAGQWRFPPDCQPGRVAAPQTPAPLAATDADRRDGPPDPGGRAGRQ
ncbi:MAG: c-type cytochrome [Azospirillum sp.]|nr:c-type cytochrome [Azospirillum sp.]